MNDNYKMEISEPDFSLKVSEWTPLTKQFLKIITEHKCNDDNGIKKTTEKEKRRLLPDPKENGWENNNDTMKVSTPRGDDSEWYGKVPRENILAFHGKANIPVYRQVHDYLMKYLPDEFTNDDIVDQIIKAFKKMLDTKLKKGSARSYYPSYKRYMKEQGLITKINSHTFCKVNKDKTEPIDTEEDKDDDDFDDGKDHCYMPEWTNDEIDVLGDTIFRYPTIEEGIANAAEKLHKTYDEVELKAKKKGMILK